MSRSPVPPLRHAILLATAWLMVGCGGSTPITPAPPPPPPPGTTDPQPLGVKHPGDANMGQDADVFFVEDGESTTLAALFGRWNGNSTANSVALDPSTSPPGSSGRQSIRLFTTAGPLGPGSIRSAGLYKTFPNGLGDTVYVRWYVKYNTIGSFHHSGPRLGGNNPLNATNPLPSAGLKPNGADFFYEAVELSGAKTGASTRSTVDFYNYWMHQRGTSFFPGLYYGNSFVNDPAVSIDLAAWNCLEMMYIANNPVSGFGGEIALWVNGVKVAHIKQGTLGTWEEDNFRPGASGTAFEGFQWRSTSALRANYLELLHFVDNDPNGLVNSVNYDHVVVARRYVGPLR